MSDPSTPQLAEEPTTDELPGAPQVKVLLTFVEGADLKAALATVGRQVYAPAPEVVVVGAVEEELPEGVTVVDSLEEAIASAGADTNYLWLLHSDARPRPDALNALVAEVERNEAALGGSKLLVAGSSDELESVGSATDVFGEPYSGLDEGEIDLQQYDVVREVAFVRSSSMLVRRDLAQGLKGLDVLLPPVAAGLDFSQRARLAGGKVISVPSSEVYHQGRCEEGQGWREQAGRLRAMLTAYSILTLLWVVPFDLFVSVIDSIANLLALRWRPLGAHLLSWLWNIYHIPSTIGLRRRFKPVRSLGDEELFRFQARGSIRLREIGSELSGRALLLFDRDQPLARSTHRVRSSPGIWGAALATLVFLFAARSLFFTGVPAAGFSFPFEPSNVALERWLAGWNESGLSSPAVVHPSVGITGLWSWLWFGSQGAARTVLTIGLGLLAIAGMGRLSGRLGLGGPGRYLAGLVLIAGPGTAVLTGVGSWLGLAGAAFLPWAVRAVVVHPDQTDSSRLSRYGWAVLLAIIVAAFSPFLVVVPLLLVVLWRLWGGRRPRLLLGLAGLAGGVVAVPFLLGDPGWALDFERRLGLGVAELWPVLVAVAALPVAFLDRRPRRFGIIGALVALIGLAVARLPYGGPGVEEASLIAGSFGAALVVAGGLDVINAEPRRLMSALASLAILLLSLGPISNGRLGLVSGDVNDRLAFAGSLAGEEGPGRVLIASVDRDDIPGEARAGPGFWYRVIDGQGMTHDEAWLPEPRLGDEDLEEALLRISTGENLRPGDVLAPFAIDWVVLEGPSFRLDEVLVAQLDLVPTPLAEDSRVFENPGSLPLADAEGDAAWVRDGIGFSGETGSGEVRLAVNYDPGWGPEPAPTGWATTVSAAEGSATFEGSTEDFALAVAAAGVALLAIVLIAVGRSRR